MRARVSGHDAFGGRRASTWRGASRRQVKPHRANTVGEPRGSRKQIFVPTKIGAPTPRLRSGAQPAPDLAKVGQPGLGAASSRDKELPERAGLASSPKRVDRPLGEPTGSNNGQGRGIESGCGRPARKTACRPNDRRAVVPRCNEGLSVCLYRRAVGDGLQDGRASGGVLHSWPMTWTA